MVKKNNRINKFKLVLLVSKQARILQQSKIKTLCTKKKQHPVALDALKQVLSVISTTQK